MVGLKNQGATCYLNSLLQSLYFTNAFRKVDCASLLKDYHYLMIAGSLPDTNRSRIRSKDSEQRLGTPKTLLHVAKLRRRRLNPGANVLFRLGDQAHIRTTGRPGAIKDPYGTNGGTDERH